MKTKRSDVWLMADLTNNIISIWQDGGSLLNREEGGEIKNIVKKFEKKYDLSESYVDLITLKNREKIDYQTFLKKYL